jgi:predicted DCC family thiol-disulfide oxidoreductase YuxK
VQFIIKEDKKRIFRFSQFQSDYAQSVLRKYDLKDESHNTVILIDNGKSYTKSAAILRILKNFGGYYALFSYVIIIIPPIFRDFVYEIIANHRYRWFGKKESCMIPTAEIQDLFKK